jgi:hypothetical protein
MVSSAATVAPTVDVEVQVISMAAPTAASEISANFFISVLLSNNTECIKIRSDVSEPP